jgi:hypothetical protein
MSRHMASAAGSDTAPENTLTTQRDYADHPSRLAQASASAGWLAFMRAYLHLGNGEDGAEGLDEADERPAYE